MTQSAQPITTETTAATLPATDKSARARVITLLRHRAMSDVIVRNLGEQMEAMQLRGMSVQPLYFSQTNSAKIRQNKGDLTPSTPQFCWEISPNSPLYNEILTELSHRRRRESTLARTVDRAMNLLTPEESAAIRALYLAAPLADPATMEVAAEDMNLSLKAFRRIVDSALSKLELVLL